MKTVRELLTWMKDVETYDLDLINHRYSHWRKKGEAGNRIGDLEIPVEPTDVERRLYLGEAGPKSFTAFQFELGVDLPMSEFQGIILGNGYEVNPDSSNDLDYRHTDSHVNLFVKRGIDPFFTRLGLVEGAEDLQHTPYANDLFGKSFSSYDFHKPDDTFQAERIFSFESRAGVPSTVRSIITEFKAISPVLEELVSRKVNTLIVTKGGDAVVHLPGVLE